MATRSRSQKKADTRAKLLAAARKVFATKGYRGAAVDDVAIEAGLTKGAVYAHFRTKEDLYLALIREQGLTNVAEVEQILESESTLKDQSAALIERATRGIAARDWTSLNLEFLLHAARDPALRREVREFMAKARQIDAELFERRWQQTSLKPALGAEDFARIVNGLTLQLAIEQLLDPRADLAPVARRTLSFLLRAVRMDENT